MPTSKAPEDLLRKLRTGHRFLLTSHRNPDGDSIGSAVGLARIVRSLGKGAVIWFRDKPPTVYESLPGSGRIHTGEEPPAGWPDKFDASIVLECPSADRSGLEDALALRPILNIDHHLGNQLYGKINWVDSAAPSVGEMVYRLAQGLKVELDPDTATALYLTLVTDTGGFRFANATPQAFEAAAALVREGASPETVAKWLYESQPPAVLRLLGGMLGSLKLHDEGRVATVHLTREMFEAAGADHGDSEGLVDYPRSIAGVEAVALFRHQEGDEIKVSLRSRGEVNVEEIASRHGGGGHKNAAGCVLEGDPEEIEEQIVGELAQALESDDEPVEAEDEPVETEDDAS